jgi:hypothetical protein
MTDVKILICETLCHNIYNENWDSFLVIFNAYFGTLFQKISPYCIRLRGGSTLINLFDPVTNTTIL